MRRRIGNAVSAWGDPKTTRVRKPLWNRQADADAFQRAGCCSTVTVHSVLKQELFTADGDDVTVLQLNLRSANKRGSVQKAWHVCCSRWMEELQSGYGSGAVARPLHIKARVERNTRALHVPVAAPLPVARSEEKHSLALQLFCDRLPVGFELHYSGWVGIRAVGGQLQPQSPPRHSRLTTRRGHHH
eukprot:4703-Prorocentrum_minimum.AAC.4